MGMRMAQIGRSPSTCANILAFLPVLRLRLRIPGPLLWPDSQVLVGINLGQTRLQSLPAGFLVFLASSLPRLPGQRSSQGVAVEV